MGEAPRLKPLKVTEILDAAFRLYRENFGLFLGVFAVSYLPALVLILILTGILMSSVPQLGNEDIHPEEALDIVWIAVLFALAISLIHMAALHIATGALTRAVGGKYLNEKVTLGGCYRYVFSVVFRYLLTILLYTLVIALGMVLCFIPGIIFAVFFVFTSCVCILEGRFGTTAMARSRELVRNHFWRVVGLGAIMILINWALSWGIGAFSGLAIPALVENIVTQQVLSQALNQVVTMIITPIFSVAWILLYYDIRIRKEGFDLEVLARDMATPSGFFEQGDSPQA
jgi:hypothetical protein